MNTIGLGLRAGMLALAVGLAQAASAQDMPAEPASDTASSSAEAAAGGGDIIVTAQRRKESLLKTPLAISAITGETLAARGVDTVAALSTQLPSLQIADSGGGTTTVFMRGVGSTNVSEVGDSAVAIQVDGIYIARPNSFGSLLYDLDRIEVLRGPQGTLYGRNATAGAINVITKRPTFDFGGNAAVEFGNYGALLTTGALNVPLSDTVAVRASFQTARHDGYQKSISTGPGAGNDKQGQDDQSGRLQLLWQPSSRFSVLLRGDYLHQGGPGGGDISYPLIGGPREFASQVTTRIDNNFWSVGGEARYDFGFAELTYLTGYNSTKIDRLRENTANNRPNYLNLKTNTYSNELRLGHDSGSFKWVTGLYVFDENTFTDYRVYAGTAANTYTQYLSPTVRSNSKAAFGQVTWSVLPSLRLTGGLRYTHDEKSRYGGVYRLDANGNRQATISVNAADNSWSSTNWKVGVDYDVSPDTLIYANVGTGYKAGGYYDGLAPNSYDPEHITAYEVGLKSRMLDGAVQLSLSGFWYDYKDFQVTAQRMLEGTLSSITINADRARIYGIELEGNVRLSSADRIDAYVTWLNSKYTNFVLPLGDAITNNNTNAAYNPCYTTDYSAATPREASFNGCGLAKAPSWTINFGYQHMFTLGNGGTVTPRVQTHFEAAQYLEYHGFPQNRQGAYTKTDLTLTYDAPGSKWSAMLFVRNVEDNDIRINSSPNTGTGLASNGSGDYYAPPRTYGARLSLNF